MARLIKAWRLPSLQIELHITSCIVSHPPGGIPDGSVTNSKSCISLASETRVSKRRALIVPANEELVGTKLPYFPMKESPPADMRTNNWCGMEIGSQMFYPMQVVDGRVHSLGGAELKSFLKDVPECSPGVKCPQGEVVLSTAPAALGENFSALLHTVPPMWDITSEHKESVWATTLRSCYIRALDKAWPRGKESKEEAVSHAVPSEAVQSKSWWNQTISWLSDGQKSGSCGGSPLNCSSWTPPPLDIVATPVLGAGARKAPFHTACLVAAEAVRSWAQERASIDSLGDESACGSRQRVLSFALLDEQHAAVLAERLQHELKNLGV